jgi:hypothetical protein
MKKERDMTGKSGITGIGTREGEEEGGGGTWLEK